MATIGMVRFSFAQVFEPKAMQVGQDPKYSIMCLIDKKDTKTLAQVKELIDMALKKGIKDGVITEGQTKSKNFKIALRDGDEYYNEQPGPAREACKGNFFFNASCKEDRPPKVVNSNLQPIIDKSEFYSGCYGYIEVNAYPYNVNGGFGIAMGLNAVMKKTEGDRLDNRVSVEDAFKDVADMPAEGGSGELE